MSSYTLTIQTGHSHLQRLVILRCIAVVAQLVTLGLVYRFLEMKLQWLPMIVAIFFLAVLSFLTWIRLRNSKPISNAEFFFPSFVRTCSFCLCCSTSAEDQPILLFLCFCSPL